jgi:hypothetical protein
MCYRRWKSAEGNLMTIQFEKLKARLLADPKIKAEYDALAPEFEVESGPGSKRYPDAAKRNWGD